MDKLDYLILAELFEDARTPFLTIARKIGVSPYTVKQRYEQMRQKGVVIRSVVSIDLSKIGYQGKVFLLINLNPETSKVEVLSGLGKIVNIISTSELVGEFDMIAVAAIIDFESIKSVVNQVKSVPGVQRVQITCINDTTFPLNASFGKILSQKSRELAAKREFTGFRERNSNLR
jgi:Lrp/AsnC family transcriptional regulator, regulator for asnA, asnC and gidA